MMSGNFNHFLELLAEIYDIRMAAEFLEWDQHTYMPSGVSGTRAEQIGNLNKIAHRLFTAKKMGTLLEKLDTSEHDLPEWGKDLVRITKHDYLRQIKIPSPLVEKISRAAASGLEKWIQAREENNFTLFEPALDTIFKLNGELADHIGFRNSPYDVLLDEFEPGMTTDKLENVFQSLQNNLREMITGLDLKFPECRKNLINWPVESQKKLNLWLIEKLGFNLEFGRLDTSVHPFTMAFTRKDVRITTKYNEKDFTTALMGTIHETGHALYEQHLPTQFMRTPLGQAASIGFHESQSRFYENIIGRSWAFWKFLSPHLAGFNAAMGTDNPLRDLFLHVNRVKPSLIRIEADEITYNLHVIIRFRLEKKLLENELSVKEVPEYWNEQYRNLLGIIPPDMQTGALQDIHWAIGLIGYFPTYTLGNIISAQLEEQLLKDIPDFYDQVAMGNFIPINKWMESKVHSVGKRKFPEQLIQDITGEGLNAKALLTHYQNKIDEMAELLK